CSRICLLLYGEGRPPTPSGPAAEGTWFGKSTFARWKSLRRIRPSQSERTTFDKQPGDLRSIACGSVGRPATTVEWRRKAQRGGASKRVVDRSREALLDKPAVAPGVFSTVL